MRLNLCKRTHFSILHYVVLVISIFVFISAQQIHIIEDDVIVQSKTKFVKADYVTGFDLGENGIAIVASSYKEGGSIAMVKSDGNVGWTHTFPNASKWFKDCEFAYSNDGNDLYTIMRDGGGSKLHINRIDVKSGMVDKNVCENAEFKNMKDILWKFATPKYLFILASRRYYEDVNFRKDPSTILYRFDKLNKEFKEIAIDSGVHSEQGTFKQIVRVTDGYADTYSITSVFKQEVVINFQRIDTAGLTLKNVAVKLPLESAFTRSCNSDMVLGRGVARGLFSPNRHDAMSISTTVLKTPDGKEIYDIVGDYLNSDMATCYPVFNELERCYYFIGLCGEDAPDKGYKRCTGFYIAKIDTEFNLLSLKEHVTLPLLNSDYFNLNPKTASRFLQTYVDPLTGDLIVYCYSAGQRYMFTVDKIDLMVQNSQLQSGFYYNIGGGYLFNDSRFLLRDTRIISAVNAYKEAPRVYYMSTRNRQYCTMIPFNKKELLFSSKTIYTQ